ncbi:hypothetical protein BBF93_04580 [Hyphomonas sp. CACIAM 19H1]|uniref:nucleotidyl transferase AbiEii/AbiGii toxin family protein n=1 Tax=Hyphomonas sp. CACIAM 19H1 TaxID=1873716 RepID=UPI000DEDA65F|nr:nucleotidyl transferase AbiEii/AbiGii toxin family protein [Hyphomonas sp. CACIAM 19H1]AXE63574.1 hypothetical protein BBF93_04580 [Hyphomonas sp. CACIAM 19H1]
MPSDEQLQAFLSLANAERAEALAVAADVTGRPAHLLEKDVWVVWTLNKLFSTPFGGDLVFKGGTSLSKAYDVINRFSEDIDLTYDITAFIPDLATKESGGIPPSRSQATKWTNKVREDLPAWVSGTAMPAIEAALKTDGLTAKLTADGEKLTIAFAPAAVGNGYVKPEVVAEFGARSTGEPATAVEISCDAATALPTLTFPTAKVRAMAPERTFWEKATAVHVFCEGGRHRGRPAFARHWHDLVRLQRKGIADKAIADKALASAVATHKSMFFREKNAENAEIDYAAAVGGNLTLVPTGDRLEELRNDYQSMINDGLLFDDVDDFETLLVQIEAIQNLANETSGK